jgi:uncharacterized protein YggE
MHAIIKPVIAVLLMAGPVMAQEVPRQITVTGEGSVNAAPDTAFVTLGVSHVAPTAAEAVAAMSTDMAAVFERLTAAGITGPDVQTGQLQLYPTYGDSSYETSPPVTGYVAATDLTVRIRELDAVGGVLDAVVQGGANTFGGIRFDLADPDVALADARRDAVADGRAKAELYAAAAGVTLGELVTLNEVNHYFAPVMAEARLAAAVPVPIAAGEVNYSVSVTMVYAIAE